MMTYQDHVKTKGPVEFHVFVHSDGDNEIWWSPKSQEWDGMDVVKDTTDELRQELLDYGNEEEHIEAALKELEEKEAHERVEV